MAILIIYLIGAVATFLYAMFYVRDALEISIFCAVFYPAIILVWLTILLGVLLASGLATVMVGLRKVFGRDA